MCSRHCPKKPSFDDKISVNITKLILFYVTVCVCVCEWVLVCMCAYALYLQFSCVSASYFVAIEAAYDLPEILQVKSVLIHLVLRFLLIINFLISQPFSKFQTLL